ncbi:4620_t:CDS:2 [Racocetra persica]|uniref:4620_t:CDS:1 n=1 Tax=Racocetra persica TaxID=160502 RepID=A0ACA9LTQ7_9GLOM|nr:4620_t:CDS:2 [Racocetra persica]
MEEKNRERREKYQALDLETSGRRNYQYSRKCLKLTDAEVNSLLQSQQNYVIRFQVNQRKNYQLIDLVRGPVNFPGSDIEDFVLCRSNGVPLLNFAVQLQKQLSQLPKWELEDIKLGLQSVCLDNQAPKKEFYSLIRKLLTGKQRGPELPQIIFLLGKKLVEKRLSKDFRGFFPILREQKSLVYLDNAATSLKPETVIQAVTDYYQKCSINSHSESNNPWFQQTRQLVAKKIAAQAEEIIFVPSATYALNILALSLCDYLTSGDKIALTHLEHSSNLYPWQAAAQSQAAEIVFLPLTKDFVINIDQLPNYINHQTKIVSFFHLSNSLGTINPVAEITRQIKKINPECLVIVDACQRGGKKNSPDEKITPLDLFLPQKFEVGTLPLAQIFGLRASLEFVNKLNLAEINHHETQLRNYALHQLNQIPSLIIYNQKQFSPTIITFNLAGCHAHDVADYLGKKNILLRAGDFCCPYLAEVIGVNSALRISLDIHNNQDDIDRLIDCLQEIVNNPQVLVPFG